MHHTNEEAKNKDKTRERIKIKDNEAKAQVSRAGKTERWQIE